MASDESVWRTPRNARLLNKRALVTGAARGIGKSIASLFSEEDAAVAYVDVDGAELKRHASKIDFRKVLFIEGDATSPDSVERFVAATLEHFGGLDVVVNNVGMSTR